MVGRLSISAYTDGKSEASKMKKGYDFMQVIVTSTQMLPNRDTCMKVVGATALGGSTLV
jgi:hypothetical protein